MFISSVLLLPLQTQNKRSADMKMKESWKVSLFVCIQLGECYDKLQHFHLLNRVTIINVILNQSPDILLGTTTCGQEEPGIEPSTL